jgi:hypothetical protein
MVPGFAEALCGQDDQGVDELMDSFRFNRWTKEAETLTPRGSLTRLIP